MEIWNHKNKSKLASVCNITEDEGVKGEGGGGGVFNINPLPTNWQASYAGKNSTLETSLKEWPYWVDKSHLQTKFTYYEKICPPLHYICTYSTLYSNTMYTQPPVLSFEYA